MTQYAYFKKGNLDFLLEDGTKIAAPKFINKGAKNYRFHLKNNILEKKCIECETFLDVQKLIAGEFIDIHDETKIHYISESSGYQGKCKSCLNREQNPQENVHIRSVSDENNFSLTDENLNYIQILSLIKNISEDETLNFIVSIIRKHNRIEYKESIK